MPQSSTPPISNKASPVKSDLREEITTFFAVVATTFCLVISFEISKDFDSIQIRTSPHVFPRGQH